MAGQAAVNIIAETFNRPYNEGRFSLFVRNLLNDLDVSKTFDLYGNYIPDSFKGHIRRYKRIGKYFDSTGNKLDVLAVRLGRDTALVRARTTQRNFIAWYLKNRGEKDAALVAFYTDNQDDWRFSLVRMEYRQEITESGRVRVREELTPARRYSFLVGKNEPNHTAQAQLLPILADDRRNPTIEEIEKAFSVETVTSRFYQEYRGLFERLTRELEDLVEKNARIKGEFELKSIEPANFAKKLLGQIVFLYFLQKKGWLGVGRDEQGNFKSWGRGPKNFLKKLFDRRFIEYENFFNDTLEPLFYAALATERENDYYDRLDIRIPFLNGGLFEPINSYNWQETEIPINNDFFAEVFRTLDTYNFTVCEDEPLEKEVAVDPEMLGKVFENLLPDNLRKGQGTYYTPRTIVHYMCRESLVHYLDSAVNTGNVLLKPDTPEQAVLFGGTRPRQAPLAAPGRKAIISRQDIEDFIRKGEFAVEHEVAKKGGDKAYKKEGTKTYRYQVPESIREHAKILDEKLADIKVCDPAIGSGAFAVGMMHEIVKARSVLATYLEDDGPDRKVYELKRTCIQNSIHGVDIDPGAIDIAQLRLWLSLVVDEDDYHTIRPLPNLDYKIMQGDSLVEEFHGISLNMAGKKTGAGMFGRDPELDRMIADLHQKQNELFSAIRVGEKKGLKEGVEEAIVAIFHHELERQKRDYFRDLDRIREMAAGIPNKGEHQQWYGAEKAGLDKKHGFDCEALEQELREMTHGNMTRNFFPWELYFADVFSQHGGFDIVIGNPPYVRQETIKEIKPRLKAQFGRFFCGTADLYTYFYKRGLDILRNSGHLCFIAPNKFMRAAYGKNTRKLLTTEAALRVVIDFGDLPIFDATTYPAILLLEKKTPVPDEEALAATFTKKEQLERVENTISDIGFLMKISALSKQGWNLERPEVLALMDKLRSAGTPLGEYVEGRFYYGIKTGLNEAFVIDEATRERLIAEDPKSAELIKPWLRGRDIKRWKTEWAGLYVINLPSSANRTWPWSGAETENEARELFARAYPAIHTHLSQWEVKLKKRDDQGKFWWELRSCAYYKEFERPKITWGNLATSPQFVMDYSSAYVSAPANIMPVNNLYLLAILNSQIGKWVISMQAAIRSGGFLEFKPMYVGNIPIFSATPTQKNPILKRVEKILADPDSPDVPRLEKEIDELGYNLYGLTPEEIAIVEGKVIENS